MASERTRPASSGSRLPKEPPTGVPAGTVIVLLVLACLVLAEIWLLKINWATVTASTRNTLLAVAWCLIPLIAIGLGIASSVRYQRQQQRDRR